MRGKLLLSVRFAFPGDTAEGERLVAPLRAAAPVYLDMLGELPTTELGRIHNDPRRPDPGVRARDHARPDRPGPGHRVPGDGGPERDSPFFAGEMRHLGAAASRDVPGGSAVGGRACRVRGALVAARPELFDSVVPAASARWDSTAAPWISEVNNANVVSQPITPERVAACWPDDIRERLGQVRRRYDPDGVTLGWWTP